MALIILFLFYLAMAAIAWYVWRKALELQAEHKREWEGLDGKLNNRDHD